VTSYTATAIRAFLVDQEGADPDAAKRAGRAIADAWNDHEFWWTRTSAPLAAALTGGQAAVDAAVDRLARHFDVHVRHTTWESTK
jgi:hypothetical protein